MGEDMLCKVVKDVKGIDVSGLFLCMIYVEVMDCFGLDKFDICFGMEFINVLQFGKEMNFKVFKDMVDNNGEIKVIVVKDVVNKYICKDMDVLIEFVNIYGVKGLVWVKVVDDGLSGLIVRFFEDVNVEIFKQLIEVKFGDLVMFVVDKFNVVV